MEFKLYTSVHEFYGDVHDALAEREAQNMLILGNLIIGVSGEDRHGWRDPRGWVMAVVRCDDNVRMVALMTPPWNVTLYLVGDEVDEKAVSCLVQGFLDNGISIPGVTTEKELAEAFAARYCAAARLIPKVHTPQRIYELIAVNPEIPQVGELRLGREGDLSFLPYWLADFSNYVGNPAEISDDIDDYRYHIDGGKLYILEDGGMPVSVAKINRQTESAACVGFVYTPPYFRGRGYASSVVAQISQLYLDKGFKSCVLYTDLANPTSNSIYQKIGYNPICDSMDIKFKEDD
ncbi:MAG: GNAT family N-acetyltransferase [Defluviitaleaceae bacterium]|nr:GNAT family N-acetyltransferase [Defluviitaleaceae bacterium]